MNHHPAATADLHAAWVALNNRKPEPMLNLFQIKHVASHQVFIGIFENPTDTVIAAIMNQLRAGTFYKRLLQRAFNTGSLVEIDIIESKMSRQELEQAYVVLAEKLIQEGKLNRFYLTKPTQLVYWRNLTYTLPRPYTL